MLAGSDAPYHTERPSKTRGASWRRLRLHERTGGHAMNSPQYSELPLTHRALFVLLLLSCILTGLIFPTHAFTLPSAWGMRLSAVGLGALALLTLYALWDRKVWAAWATLAVVSGIWTVDL